MKNKTLALIGIILISLDFIGGIKVGSNPENVNLLFPTLHSVIGLISFIYIIVISIKLWYKNKILIIGLILTMIISTFTIDLILILIMYGLVIAMIIKLYKSDRSDKEVIYPKKEGGNIFIGIFGLIFTIFFILGWILNIVNFFRLDFKEPFKAEVIRGIGVIMFPMGSIMGYIPIKE